MVEQRGPDSKKVSGLDGKERRERAWIAALAVVSIERFRYESVQPLILYPQPGIVHAVFPSHRGLAPSLRIYPYTFEKYLIFQVVLISITL